ncbi:MAG: hypothetical protein QM489_07675 [Candidatus Izemoplasma sp.]
MNMLEILNFNYFLWVAFIPISIYVVYYLLKGLTEKQKFYFLFGLTVFAWIVHFSRYWLEPNLNMYNMFFTDFCGFSTLLYPFFMISKKKIFKDYMFYLGGVMAMAAVFYPHPIIDKDILAFNSIRFYLAHLILVMVPMLLVMWKMHVPNIKNLGWMFLMLIMGAIYNMALSAFFVEVGLRDDLANYMGAWGNTEDFFEVAQIIAPWITYTKVVDGVTITNPIPLLYIIPAGAVFLFPFWSLMTLPFIKKENNYVYKLFTKTV